MIELTQEEVYTFNIISNQITNIQAEMQRLIAAKDSYISLLEGKYNATFNKETGKLEEK